MSKRGKCRDDSAKRGEIAVLLACPLPNCTADQPYSLASCANSSFICAAQFTNIFRLLEYCRVTIDE